MICLEGDERVKDWLDTESYGLINDSTDFDSYWELFDSLIV